MAARRLPWWTRLPRPVTSAVHLLFGLAAALRGGGYAAAAALVFEGYEWTEAAAALLLSGGVLSPGAAGRVLRGNMLDHVVFAAGLLLGLLLHR